jgi:hypothetical protein
MVDSNTLRLGLIAATAAENLSLTNYQSRTNQQARKGIRMFLIYQEVSFIMVNSPVLFMRFSR